MCLGTLWSQSASAQVTGTFFPTAVGEIQEPGRTPFPQLSSPQLPVAEQQMKQLENDMMLQRRPYLNFMSSYANQSQVQVPGQLDTFTPQIAEYGFFPTKQSETRFSYIPTIFGLAGLKSPRVFGQEYRVTYNSQPTTRLKFSNRLGLYQYAGTDKVSGGLNVLGVATGQYAINDRVHFTGGFRRDILGSTLLSATGINLPGTSENVGRVTQNLFFGLLDFRPTRKTYVGVSYGGGFDQGSHVKTNPFQQFGLSVSHPLYERESTRRLSLVNFTYQLLEFNWKYDLSSIGNTALQLQPFSPADTVAMADSAARGQTQIPASAGVRQAGVGGYFSPQKFWINSWGLGVAGRIAGPVYYRGGGGVAIGSSKGAGQTSLSPPGFGGFGNAAITARLNKHVVVENGWIYFQSQTVYRRQVLYSQCKYYF